MTAEKLRFEGQIAGTDQIVKQTQKVILREGS